MESIKGRISDLVTTTSTATVPELLELLAQVRSKKDVLMAEITPVLEAIAADEAVIRAEIEIEMERGGSLRTESAGGLYGLISITKRPAVVDPQAAMDWLDQQGVLKRYMKLDGAAVLKDYGKADVPGIRIDESRAFSIRESK